MNEHDIFKEFVYRNIPKRIDDYIIECYLLDDDFKIRQGRKEMRMVATSVEKPSKRTIAKVLPFDSVDEYVDRRWVEKMYFETMKRDLFEMLHKMIEWINSANKGFEIEDENWSDL